MRSAMIGLWLTCSWIMQRWPFANAAATSIVRSARSSSNNTMPQALVIPASEYFEGNDGPWSSFNIRIGTPEQDVRVLVSTASPESMVVLSDGGCSPAAFNALVPSDCAVQRGNLFDRNGSSSWNKLGDYGINAGAVGLEANLGYSQAAEFAQETVGIGLNGPTLNKQIVAGIETTEPFYLGIFGLNNQPVNFSSLSNHSSLPFLSSLKDQDLIPSLSWSYTAGASYRLKQVYGQLIFSGYDTSRFTENSVSFTMAGDVTRDLVVVLQSISYSGTNTSTLLSEPITIFLDSTDPNLWLPNEVCDAFENAFGLTLDDTTGLYLVNDTHHTALLDSNAEVSFRLSDVTSGGEAVRIILPYQAFDLTAEAPLVANSSHYFPLKRAANSSQYTLGRTFFQEAYISADYERGVFNVSACTWVEGAQENIITITPKSSDLATSPDCSLTTTGCSSTSGSLSLGAGAVAGIVVGSVILVIIAIVAAFIMVRRRKRKTACAAMSPDPNSPSLKGVEDKAEPEADEESKKSARKRSTELNGHTELDGAAQQIYQLHGETRQPVVKAPVYYELAGSEAGRVERDEISVGDISPSRDEGRGEVPFSPYVSTMGTSGWQNETWDASSDMVSPTTPEHRGARLAERYD